MNLYEVKFSDGTVLEYTKKAGSAAPLFVTKSLMRALGYKSDSPGMLYKPGFQKYTLLQPLKRGKKPVMLVHLNGVLKLLGNRHPEWETEFLERFLVRFEPEEDTSVANELDMETPKTPQTPTSIRPDNLDLLEFKGDVTRRLAEQDERMTRIEKLLTELVIPVDTAEKIEPPTETKPINVDEVVNVGSVVMVPVRGAKGTVAVKVNPNPRFVVGKIGGQAVYSHVEGYRTYKEMCDEAGCAQFINTIEGRSLSGMISKTCEKHGIPIYYVIDGHRSHVVDVAKVGRNYGHVATYVLQAYPADMWHVVAPHVEEKISGKA